jgi:uncharacterized RDD family membrane protein YckC
MESNRHSPGNEREDITHLGPRQVFHSAEHVALEVPIAGPTSRILAYFIDTLCVTLLLLALVVAAVLVLPGADGVAERIGPMMPAFDDPLATPWTGMMWVLAVVILVQFVLEWLYFIVLEMITGGRSIGKALLGLRVCMDGGLPVTANATVMRNLLRIVDVLPLYYVIGLTSMIVSRSGKRIGDHAAGTIVVRLDRPAPAPPIPIGDDDPDFRFRREHLARVDGDARMLLRQTLRRLDVLSPEQRAAVVRRAAEALRQRIGYRDLGPDEDERFLRSLLRELRRGA